MMHRLMEVRTSCLQSESVKYFLDNLDRIGQLVSHSQPLLKRIYCVYILAQKGRYKKSVCASFIFSCVLCRAIFPASRTFCLPGRPRRASSSTTLSSKRSPSRWSMWEVRGHSGKSGSSVLMESRQYSSWCPRPSMIRYTRIHMRAHTHVHMCTVFIFSIFKMHIFVLYAYFYFM